MTLTRAQEIVLDLQLAIDAIVEAWDGGDLAAAVNAAREAADTVPNDGGLYPASSQHYIDTGRYFPVLDPHELAPDVFVGANDDGSLILVCPHPGCNGTDIAEVDESQRWNPLMWRDDTEDFGIYEGDAGDGYASVGFVCTECGEPVNLPDFLDTPEWVG